ncbi:MmcQ/YjbR family DNA-binding protein [Shewanella sp. NIFS-20-20]|uniref:MmcQ/YjbR family DNA-binding protein n=1 Tax=Shewanella sp. NIFS-20-20 TaxID=2853806 RepID=UPI001C47BBDC|nr:MmcQ/YjbR family DNA-binding protein [Shewanella sp. NIFS-20-20]MBV7314992.1 MmcQ/YjbR family DNA-binding protein [Shewanella sp. NIFS-20-20]
MTVDEFNHFCQSLPATTYVQQWGASHVWKVGGKVFAIGSSSASKVAAYTFKTTDNNFHFLGEIDGYRPAPYFGSRGMKWIQQFDNAPSKDEDLRYYLSQSYRLVCLGLTIAMRRQLGLEQPPTKEGSSNIPEP